MTSFRTWQLFAVCIGVWGTTWHAITYQLTVNAPEVGVALRFALAAVAVLGGCALRGAGLPRFTRHDHALFALQGGFMYGVAYVCVYHAERHLPSGLVAVGYSASPLLAGVGARALFGVPLGRRFVGGGLLGLLGVALMFWPEFGRAAAASSTARGVAFTVAAVLLSAAGSLVASRNRGRGLPFWPSLGFGMGYGALAAAAIAAVSGHGLVLPALDSSSGSWWLSLGWLAGAGSVVAFACFLTLQDRLGPGPSSTIGVMTPLVALLVSLLFEGFEPAWPTLAGAALAVAGNALMLIPVAAAAAPSPPAGPAFRPSAGDAAAAE